MNLNKNEAKKFFDDHPDSSKKLGEYKIMSHTNYINFMLFNLNNFTFFILFCD